MRATSRPRRDPRLDPLAQALHGAAIRILRRLRRADRALGVGPAQLSALSVLVFGGPQTSGRLAAIEQVSRPTMTRVVAGLERAGLVERTPHPADGRAYTLRATPAGTRLMQRGRRARVALLARARAGLAADERAVLEHASELMTRLAATDDARDR